MIKLPKGTVEVLYINITDRLGEIDDLEDDGATVTWELRKSGFDVDDDDGDVDDGNCTTEGMIAATTPINTSGMEEGYYSLYLNIALGSENIKMGPYTVLVG